MEAARKLQRMATGWSSKRNPVVETTKVMSEMMAAMVKAGTGNEDNMGQLVTTSKDIASAGARLVSHATDCANNCSDKTLKADLLKLCERIPTISVQLRILASVSATLLAQGTRDQDPETEAMLVTNAQNLMEAVTRTLKTCHAASLKPVEQNPNIATLLWRKQTMSRRRSMMVSLHLFRCLRFASHSRFSSLVPRINTDGKVYRIGHGQGVAQHQSCAQKPGGSVTYCIAKPPD